jgi:hypothetical protein
MDGFTRGKMKKMHSKDEHHGTAARLFIPPLPYKSLADSSDAYHGTQPLPNESLPESSNRHLGATTKVFYPQLPYESLIEPLYTYHGDGGCAYDIFFCVYEQFCEPGDKGIMLGYLKWYSISIYTDNSDIVSSKPTYLGRKTSGGQYHSSFRLQFVLC